MPMIPVDQTDNEMSPDKTSRLSPDKTQALSSASSRLVLQIFPIVKNGLKLGLFAWVLSPQFPAAFV